MKIKLKKVILAINKLSFQLTQKLAQIKNFIKILKRIQSKIVKGFFYIFFFCKNDNKFKSIRLKNESVKCFTSV